MTEELKRKAKYSMIKDNILYIEKLNLEVRNQCSLLNKYIDELGITDEELDIPLGDLMNCEGSERLLTLVKEKLGLINNEIK